MCAAVVPVVVEMLDHCGGLATWVLVADVVDAVAGTTAAIVCAATTVVAAATATIRMVATATATAVAVTTTTVVAAATVAAAAAVVATALLSTAASATWALLVVDAARRGMAITNGLLEHLEFPLYRHDVGRVGSERFLGSGVCRAKIGHRIRE
jgi:hypothetical protein